MSGVTMTVRGITFPLFDWKKCFFPIIGGSMEDRKNIFHGHLYHVIKRKLWSGWRDDPEVQMNVDQGVFSSGLGQVTLSTARKGCLERN